jgi:hypothetical protein
LELDRDGEVVAKQVVSLARHDVEDDEFSDLAEEEESLVCGIRTPRVHCWRRARKRDRGVTSAFALVAMVASQGSA